MQEDDEFGTSVAISGDTVVVGAPYDEDGGISSGSAYVFIRSDTEWSQQAELRANDAAASDRFGSSVAISDDTVVIGAYRDDNADGSLDDLGSAYVFTRSDIEEWSLQAKLTADDAAEDDEFGSTVAISDDTVVVGVPNDDDDLGSAYVFTRSDTTWSQQAKLNYLYATEDDRFGRSVAISGDTVVVGVVEGGLDDAGSAYVFTRSETEEWSQQAKLTADDGAENDRFGYSVAISGDAVIIGAPYNSSSGSAIVFTRNGTTWSQQAKLTAEDAEAYARFGSSVAISGATVVVGADRDYDGGIESGSAYVFTRSGTTWSQQAKLTAENAVAYSSFGASVSIAEDTVVVGAPNDEDGGSAYIFTHSGTTWFQQAKLTGEDAARYDTFGWSVAISDDTVIIGAPNTSNDDINNSGSAYVFTRTGSSWSQQVKLTADDAASDDIFGASVAISGDAVVVGANLDDDSGLDSGSAYVFTRSGVQWEQEAKLTPNDAATSDYFGRSVAISGNTVVVSADQDDDSGSIYIYRIAVPSVSQVLVYDSFGKPLSNSSSATAFAGQQLGTSRAYTFRITNAGELDLDLYTISQGGANSAEFSLSVPDISSNADLISNESLYFTITFSPSGASSALRHTTVSIYSNGSTPSPFSFNISGLGLSNATDGDGDGLNDFAEYSLQGLGFDWETAQPNRVNDLLNNAANAGLYTEAGIAAITGSAALIDVDTDTNTAVFTVELQESLDLEDFTPIFAEPSKLSIDENGKIRYEVTAPVGKKFYRIGLGD